MENHNGGVKTKQQMADEYGVCRKTFIKLITEQNIKLRRILISPRETVFQKADPVIPAYSFASIVSQSICVKGKLLIFILVYSFICE